MLFGAIEAGGTKMVLAIGDDDGNILNKKEIKTENPEKTIPQIKNFFNKYQICALGIGAFGPVELNQSSPKYGVILKTPKAAWRNLSWIQQLSEDGRIPIKIDTDVNAACLGEVQYGNGKGLKNLLYLTIGTGIGAGVWLEGNLLHGMLHPEAGHILIQKNEKDHYQGCCPYHEHCLEGMASGPALRERFKMEPKEIPEESEAWELEADYLAQAMVNYILCYSPQKIILGGGVMKQEHLFESIRYKTKEYLNGYISVPELQNMETYIVPAGLNGEQGIKGALFLAQEAIQRKRGEFR